MFTASFRIDRNAAKRAAVGMDKRMEAVVLNITDEAARDALGEVRQEMRANKLGNLGNALGSGSDKKKHGAVHRLPNGGFSASGWIHIRAQGDRSLGALISYTEGATIRPVRSDYLWMPTDDIRRLARVPKPRTGGGRGYGNVRLTPRLWDQTYGRKFGPLFRIKADDGTPLLVIKNATLSASGKARSARPRTKTGKVPKGQVAAEIIVAFIGIPQTIRTRRLDVRAITAKHSALMGRKIVNAARNI